MHELLNTLFVTTQGAYLRLDHDTVKVEVEGETRMQIPLHHLGGFVVFGNVLFSPFLLHRATEDGRSIVFLGRNGAFKGRVVGPTSGNVFLRRAQHEASADSERTLHIARNIVAGKIQNSRHVVLRAAREAATESDAGALRATAGMLAASTGVIKDGSTLDQVRGIEGRAAQAYFATFTFMVRADRDAFGIRQRTRRPPRDRTNALLSFFYALLLNDCVAAAEGVGLDPQVGFLHALRSGRPALGLDLMEEFRAPIADRLALSLINRKQVQPASFSIRPGGAVEMTAKPEKMLLWRTRNGNKRKSPILSLQNEYPWDWCLICRPGCWRGICAAIRPGMCRLP